MSNQYLRKWSLIASNGSKGLDLSALRIQFKISQADTETPDIAWIRVYNLSDDTANQVVNEYQQVTLQAGYENGNYAIVFQGTIAQIVRGRESNIDTFVDLYVSDGDQAFNHAVVNKSLAAGASLADQVDAIVQPMADKGATLAPSAAAQLQKALAPTGGVLPRGKVLFGMARLRLTDVANSGLATWSIQNGKITIIPLTGYLDGQAVVLNARTGMIGVPEATIDGIKVRCLLNPFVRIGTRLQIDNAAINQTTVKEQQRYPNFHALTLPATVTNDGFYRTLVAEHMGDNRGPEWWTDITCLAIDTSAAPSQSVQAYG